MNSDEHRYEHDDLTERVIGCAFTVSNTLGHGFLERVYENALAHELTKCGIECSQQVPVAVLYDNVVVGEYFADILVERRLLVELKAVRGLEDSHWAQCLNYLRATKHRTCLLINFGKARIEIKRIAL